MTAPVTPASGPADSGASDVSPARVLVAMSGGVDSSVAAALLQREGHHVVGVTMKLWGGDSDTGCCSVSDVDDARRVAQQLGIDHHVLNFGAAFDEHVVGPYVEAHAAGRTPNPCIECNRHLKFDHLLRRAEALGFDLVATGHHARIVESPSGRRIARGADAAKDQSYVLAMLGPSQLERVVLPLGTWTKAQVREEADRLGLRTAGKADSQDVCFITSTTGRDGFLKARTVLRPGVVVDGDGVEVGTVAAVQLVTVGQRKGLGLAGAATPRYVVDVDVEAGVVRVGGAADLMVDEIVVGPPAWADGPIPSGAAVLVQASAHGDPFPAVVETRSAGEGEGTDGLVVRPAHPIRRVARGQTLAFYDGDRPDEVRGSAIVVA